MAKALTIAGSDSGGGAGIQADLKTFTLLDVYGMSAVTAVTAQNTLGVFGIYPLSLEAIGKQIDVVVDDIGVDAAKTGMLADASIIETVAERVRAHGLRNLVVDPVMVAKGGTTLLEPTAQTALCSMLLPLAKVATPNVPEAEVLAGMDIRNHADMREAARRIHDMGAAYVVVKGGHMQGAARDIVYDGTDFEELAVERFETRHTHGTGCTFSAAITAELAKGRAVRDAIATAKEFITCAISNPLGIGHGHGPTNHWAYGRRK